MKHFLSLWMLVLLVFPGFSQQKQDIKVYGISLDTIASLVKKHPGYFEHLAKKIQMKDKNMSQDELMMLYYGSTFQKNYHPTKEDKSVEKIAKQIAEMDFNGAIVEGKKMLQIYPVNARLYMLLGYTYKKIGEKKKAKWYYKRYADIIRIPLYSGSGDSFDHAYVVRVISDEYLILNQVDLELTQQAVRYHNQLPFDVLHVQKKSKHNQRASIPSKQKKYFNIYLPYFVGQGRTFKSVLDEAKKRFNIPVQKTTEKSKQ